MPRYQLTAVPGIIRDGGFLHLQDFCRRQINVSKIVKRYAKIIRNFHHVVKGPRIANLEHARERLRKLTKNRRHILLGDMTDRNNHVDVRYSHIAGRYFTLFLLAALVSVSVLAVLGIVIVAVIGSILNTVV